jgi:hypothetical protein
MKMETSEAGTKIDGLSRYREGWASRQPRMEETRVLLFWIIARYARVGAKDVTSRVWKKTE